LQKYYGNFKKILRNTFSMSLPLRTLFLIDGLGALVSAALLSLMALMPHIAGMPASILWPLALIAVLFAVYSLSCYALRPRRQPLLLALIAIANLSYCALTFWFVRAHYAGLTALGLCYFVGEMAILVALAGFELTMAKKSPE
jgi:hypothetical protein